MTIRIGITLGDPAGIGPEVAIKAIVRLADLPVQWIIFGPESLRTHPRIQVLGLLPESLHWENCGELSDQFLVGHATAESGKVIEAMLTVANTWAMNGKIDALVTAPINKTSLHLAGLKYTGHTTMLQALSNTSEVSMAFYSPTLKVILTTIHHRYSDVPSLLTPNRLKTTIRHAYQFTRMLGISNPKIAMAGLNPHAGEGGLFGDEEIRLLLSPIDEMSKLGFPVTGPLSPDTVFRRAFDDEFDLVIALYHDQGLIPLKLLAFDSAVNVTIGLPYIRVSPDHGTAYDIAYQNMASEHSMMSAIQLAMTLNVT